jgi:hypothetical protein
LAAGLVHGAVDGIGLLGELSLHPNGLTLFPSEGIDPFASVKEDPRWLALFNLRGLPRKQEHLARQQNA